MVGPTYKINKNCGCQTKQWQGRRGEKEQVPATCEGRCPGRSAVIAVTTMASWLAATGGRARLTPAATIDFGAVILYGRASRSGQRHGHLPRSYLLPAPVSASS